MRKIVFILSLLVTFSVYSQEKGKLSFNKEVIDFGELKEGDTAKKSLTFKNEGSQPVFIKKISSTGHVNVEEYPMDEIQPNANSKIVISYNTKVIGPIRRTLTIYSNAENPIISIKIKGKVLQKD